MELGFGKHFQEKLSFLQDAPSANCLPPMLCRPAKTSAKPPPKGAAEPHAKPELMDIN